MLLIIFVIFFGNGLVSYHDYTSKAKFTEVTSLSSVIKQQVELCYFDQGTLENCDSDKPKPSDARGWDLEQSVGYAHSRYVARVEVTDGVITMYSQNINDKEYTFILVPTEESESRLRWSISPDSTCLKDNLC